MKTRIEISGYVIDIEEIEGRITVKADKDDETVEEFTLEPEESTEGEEGQEEGEDGVKSFGEYGDEEDDFEGEEGAQEEGSEDLGGEEGAQEEEEEEEMSANESTNLDSFQSFLEKNK